jgi:hypothetical protein
VCCETSILTVTVLLTKMVTQESTINRLSVSFIDPVSAFGMAASAVQLAEQAANIFLGLFPHSLDQSPNRTQTGICRFTSRERLIIDSAIVVDPNDNMMGLLGRYFII